MDSFTVSDFPLEVRLKLKFHHAVKNHGVSQDIIDKCFGCAKEFFDIPLDEKMKISTHLSDSYRGYTVSLESL